MLEAIVLKLLELFGVLIRWEKVGNIPSGGSCNHLSEIALNKRGAASYGAMNKLLMAAIRSPASGDFHKFPLLHQQYDIGSSVYHWLTTYANLHKQVILFSDKLIATLHGLIKTTLRLLAVIAMLFITYIMFLC